MDEATLLQRFVEPYAAGRPITSGGRTISPAAIDRILIIETESTVGQPGMTGWTAAWNRMIADRTDDFITGPPGGVDDASALALAPGVTRDSRRVMIVHGRNNLAVDAMRSFLQSLGLVPVLWEDAIEETGEGSPHNLDAVTAAMSVAQAVVVLFTAEDEARLIDRFRAENDDDALMGQPRPNVLIEAGMALALGRERTVLVRLGDFRGASDVDGLSAVNLTNQTGPRVALRRRLRNAGCALNDREDYLEPGVAGDFDRAIVGH